MVISPNELNRNIRTIIVAPMTIASRAYPSRVDLTFRGKKGQVVLDQIRTLDKQRLVKRLGKLDQTAATEILQRLAEMFAP